MVNVGTYYTITWMLWEMPVEIIFSNSSFSVVHVTFPCHFRGYIRSLCEKNAFMAETRNLMKHLQHEVIQN